MSCIQCRPEKNQAAGSVSGAVAQTPECNRVSDLFREAEDEIRRETVETVAKRSVPFVIAIAVLALVIGGGVTAWQHFEKQGLEQGNAALAAATEKLNANDLDGGIAALEALTKSGPRKVRDHAILLRASAISVKGDAAAALVAFDEAVKSIGNRDLADIARLRAAYIAADTETREQVSARLKPLIDGKGPMAPLAQELSAAMAWAAGDSAAARSEYELLQLDPNAPEGLRERAGQAIAVIDSGATPSDQLMPIGPPQGQGGPQVAPAQPGQPQPGQPGQGQAQQGRPAPKANQAGGVVSDDFLKELERERAAEEARQRETTRQQQREVDAEVARRVDEARKAEPAAPPPAAPAEPKAEPAQPAKEGSR
jgi:hypothetical protein